MDDRSRIERIDAVRPDGRGERDFSDAASFIVGILGFLGAVLQGANVSEAIGEELIGGVTLSPAAATIALLIAGSLVSIGIFTGYPIATAFTMTGAVIGIGLAMGGDPVWPKYLEIGSMWVLTPFVGAASRTRLPVCCLSAHAGRMPFWSPSRRSSVQYSPTSNSPCLDRETTETHSKTIGGAMLVSTILGLLGVTVGLMIVLAGATTLSVRSDAERTQRIFLL